MPGRNRKVGLSNPMEAGREALAQGEWEKARLAFEAVLKKEETPEALEGLAKAAFFLNDADAMFEARERAYRLYRERGDRRGAARVAIALAVVYSEFRGEEAVAKGWLQRTRSLLEGLEACPEHGWLAVWQGIWSLPDTVAAKRLGAEAAVVGRSLGIVDLEMTGLAVEGLALLSEGKISEGMLRLVEATAAAVGGELTDVNVAGVVCCLLISGCELIRDYNRAAQWCDIVEKLTQRWRVSSMFAYCRTHYSTVLLWRGDWSKAEQVLTAATEELLKVRPGLAADGVVRLGELRRRQGRWDEAAALFRRVEFHPLAQLGRAALAIDQGDAAAAADLIDRFLRHIPPEDRTERAAGLELLVQVQITLGQQGPAATSLTELKAVTSFIGTDPMRASSLFAQGLVAASEADYASAQRLFEDAVDLYERSGAPYEASRTRIELARSLAELGRKDLAEEEARTALDSLQRLGADAEAKRAMLLVTDLNARAHGQEARSLKFAGLTPRELEVLRLVAQGLSNEMIASRLMVSDHTVHRHVANILAKLNQPTRAAAVAYVGKLGLL